jgi:adenylylsulfate kinase
MADDNQAPQQRRGSASPAAPPDNQAPQQRRGSASPAAPPDNQAPQQRRGSASPAAPPHEGFCLWFTGLSGSGKSTITTHLVKELRKRGSKLEVLDGDVVRENLSKGLGFSKEDRDTNIRRIAFVANLLSRNGVPVITAAISPYREIRDEARQMMGDRFVEAYVKASVETCEERDVKGLYAKARSGEIKEFTGVSDPYEPPENPELVLETEQQSPEQSAQQILVYLEERELIPAPIAA